jgi:hypothetical protein
MNAARDKITSTYAAISGNHILWGSAFTPLFNFEIPGLSLVVANADLETRKIVITGVAWDVADVVSYRAHVEVPTSPLDLVSESLQQIEGNLQYDAEFKLK